MSHRVLIAALLCSCAAFAETVVPAAAQTPNIPSTGVGDVAIFHNTANPALSRVIGTDPTTNGLFSFSLDGGVAEYLTLGPMRGVDVKSGLKFRSAPSSVLAAMSFNAGLFLYGLSDAGMLVDARSRAVNVLGNGAVALWAPPDGGLEAWIDVGTTTLKRLAFFDDGLDAGHLDWFEMDASVTYPRGISGLVVDSRNRRMYASVATDGIYGWTIDSAFDPVLLEPTDGGSLTGPPSGLALYPLLDGGAVMLIAIAGNDEFDAYRVTNTRLTPITSFQVGIQNSANATIIVRGGLYLDITTAKTPEFPQGMVVVADHNPTTGSNYKMIRWDTLAASTDPKLPNEYDAGSDAGLVDAGKPVVVTGNCPDDDGGFSDAGDDGGADGGRRPCVRDAGPGGLIGGGGGGRSDGGVDVDEPPKPCCGGGTSNAFFPGGLVLIWTLRFRRRKT